MFTYYHGTNQVEAVVNAIEGNGQLRANFHLTTDLSTARNYGEKVIQITLEQDLTKAHVGLINKDGNFNASVGNKLETVLKTPGSIAEFYNNFYELKVI